MSAELDEVEDAALIVSRGGSCGPVPQRPQPDGGSIYSKRDHGQLVPRPPTIGLESDHNTERSNEHQQSEERICGTEHQMAERRVSGRHHGTYVHGQKDSEAEQGDRGRIQCPSDLGGKGCLGKSAHGDEHADKQDRGDSVQGVERPRYPRRTGGVERQDPPDQQQFTSKQHRIRERKEGPECSLGSFRSPTRAKTEHDRGCDRRAVDHLHRKKADEWR